MGARARIDSESSWPNPHGDYLDSSYLLNIIIVTVCFFLLLLVLRDHAHFSHHRPHKCLFWTSYFKEFVLICNQLMCILSSLQVFLSITMTCLIKNLIPKLIKRRDVMVPGSLCICNICFLPIIWFLILNRMWS